MNGKISALQNSANNIYIKLMSNNLNVEPAGNSNLWEGNARGKFYNEYPKYVTEMESVASSLFYLNKAVLSCDEFNTMYRDYLTQKDVYNQLVQDYNAARRSGDHSSISVLASLVNSARSKLSTMEQQLRNKKTEIRGFLNNIK